MKKLNQDSKTLAKLECYGMPSNFFDDSDLIDSNVKIKSIEIHSGEIIDSIKVNYLNSTSPIHGGRSGSLKTMVLDDDEYIVEISGLYGTWWNVEVIKQLTFITTKKAVTYGTDIYPFTSSSFTIKSSKEYPVVGFYGSSLTCSNGTFLSQIGAIVIVSDMPGFYKAERSKMISSLYDPAFALMKDKRWRWTKNDDSANIKFKEFKAKITGQQGYFDNPYEAQYFNSVIDKIRDTDLFQFLQGLPKGAVLHLHPSSMGDYVELLELSVQYTGDACQVRFLYQDEGKTKIDPINTDKKSFQWLSKPNKEKDANSKLGNYMNLSDALKDPILEQATVDLMVLSPEVMNYDGDMWDLFEPIFSRAGTLFQKKEITTIYYQNAFNYLVKNDNLDHAEIRSSWIADNEKVNGTTENIIVNAAINAGISLKVINFNSRHIDETIPVSTNVLKNIVDTGNAILNNKSEYLCGYDLVGEEDTGATTEFLTNVFYFAYCQLSKYLPPFFFHDGESDLAPDYNPSDQKNLSDPNTTYFNNNLVDAYLLNTLNFDGFQMSTNRVGHGLELFKTPKLFEYYKAANLAVELCPISNQLLRYIKDLREHPGQSYLAGGLPVSISSDDPAIYGYQGISFDFWEAVIAWGLDLKMVKVLCFYSLMYSALKEPEKSQKILDWSNRWDAYINKGID